MQHERCEQFLLFVLLKISDLPCMHLDPGVNRLGLNITSVHQTDCRPVTPDIVFPICVILQPKEHGLKTKTQSNIKRGQYISHIHSCSNTHASRIREASVSSLALREAQRELSSITKQQTKTCKRKRKEFLIAKLHSKRAEHLWEVQTADLKDSFGVMLAGL